MIKIATGFEFYSLEYTKELLAERVGVLGLVTWESVQEEMEATVEKLFNDGLFMCHVLDDDNQGYVNSAFIANQSTDVNLLLHSDAGSLKVTQGPSNTIRFLCPRAVRETFQKFSEVTGKPWDFKVNLFITKLVENLYQSRLIFAFADIANTEAMKEVLKNKTSTVLRLRLR